MTRQASVTPTTLLALLILRVGWFERSETQHDPSKPFHASTLQIKPTCCCRREIYFARRFGSCQFLADRWGMLVICLSARRVLIS